MRAVSEARLPFLFVSLGLQASAIAYSAAVPVPGPPPYWQRETLYCLGASSALALAVLFTAGRGLNTALLGIRAALFVVITFPSAGMSWPTFSVALSIMIDAAAAFAGPAGLIAGCAIVLFNLIRGLVPFRAWGRVIPGRPLAEELFGLVALILALALVHAILGARRARARDASLIKQLNDSILALTGANIGFLNYASTVERASIVKERNRLTREIHDSVTYTLTNIRMMMEAALRRDWESRDELSKLHEWTRDQSQRGLQDTRSILHLIRSMEEPEIKGVREIQSLVQTFMDATRVEVAVDWGNIPWSWQNDYINMTVFRIIQEGMTNAFRHGHATEIKIYFFQDDSALNIRIEDNGRGSEDFKKGIGLAGMEERLRPIEGTVSAYNTGSGFRLLARLPIGERLRVTGAGDETSPR